MADGGDSVEVYVATPMLRGLSLGPRTVENYEVAEITDAAVSSLHPRTWAWRRADRGTGLAADQVTSALLGRPHVPGVPHRLDGAGQLVAEVSPYTVDPDWSGIDEPEEIAAVVADLGRATATMHSAADAESDHSLVLRKQPGPFRGPLQVRMRHSSTMDISGTQLRVVRAALFTALVVTLSAGSHVLLSQVSLPLTVVALLAGLVFAVAYALAGRERGFGAIAGLLVPLELAADTVFTTGQHLCYGAAGGPIAGPLRSVGVDVLCGGGDLGAGAARAADVGTPLASVTGTGHTAAALLASPAPRCRGCCWPPM